MWQWYRWASGHAVFIVLSSTYIIYHICHKYLSIGCYCSIKRWKYWKIFWSKSDSQKVIQIRSDITGSLKSWCSIIIINWNDQLHHVNLYHGVIFEKIFIFKSKWLFNQSISSPYFMNFHYLRQLQKCVDFMIVACGTILIKALAQHSPHSLTNEKY